MMVKIKGFKNYAINKDSVVIEIETGNEVIPLADKNGVPFIKLTNDEGKEKRLKLSKIFDEHFNENRTDLNIVDEIKKLYYDEGIKNNRIIAKRLNVSLTEVFKALEINR
jgi:hypothetical protein